MSEQKFKIVILGDTIAQEGTVESSYSYEIRKELNASQSS